jgi:hypothetical protein
MDAAIAKALREPFPPELVGKLPKAGMQLDFVGHAAVTDRLLFVDPEWSWEPMGFTSEGLPAYRESDNETELWIRLTIAGVTRPGVGVVRTASSDLGKQLVSDALRNAAMRFGVALDLWSKEDLHATPPEPTIDTEAAGFFTRELNNGGPDMRKEWLDEFGCKPGDLPESRLAAAHAWLTDRQRIIMDGDDA